MLTRKPYWDTRAFHQFLLARANTPFAWGGNDCCMFPADAIEAITGEDIAADFRGRYSTEAEAFALIATVTGKASAAAEAVGDAAAYCAEKAGMKEWRYPLQAQRGDLVVVEDAGRLIAGVMHLNGKDVAAVGDAGLKRLPISAVKRAWHY